MRPNYHYPTTLDVATVDNYHNEIVEHGEYDKFGISVERGNTHYSLT